MNRLYLFFFFFRRRSMTRSRSWTLCRKSLTRTPPSSCRSDTHHNNKHSSHLLLYHIWNNSYEPKLWNRISPQNSYLQACQSCQVEIFLKIPTLQACQSCEIEIFLKNLTCKLGVILLILLCSDVSIARSSVVCWFWSCLHILVVFVRERIRYPPGMSHHYHMPGKSTASPSFRE